LLDHKKLCEGVLVHRLCGEAGEGVESDAGDSGYDTIDDIDATLLKSLVTLV
jgi:hypothetical protein